MIIMCLVGMHTSNSSWRDFSLCLWAEFGRCHWWVPCTATVTCKQPLPFMQWQQMTSIISHDMVKAFIKAFWNIRTHSQTDLLIPPSNGGSKSHADSCGCPCLCTRRSMMLTLRANQLRFPTISRCSKHVINQARLAARHLTWPNFIYVLGMCCSVMQCVAMWGNMLQYAAINLHKQCFVDKLQVLQIYIHTILYLLFASLQRSMSEISEANAIKCSLLHWSPLSSGLGSTMVSLLLVRPSPRLKPRHEHIPSHAHLWSGFDHVVIVDRPGQWKDLIVWGKEERTLSEQETHLWLDMAYAKLLSSCHAS